MCLQGSSQAGPAGDDVAHEEIMAVGVFRCFRMGLAERDRSLPLNHVCTFAPGLHQIFGKSANEDEGHGGED